MTQNWTINLSSNTVTVSDTDIAGEVQFRLLEMSQYRESGYFYSGMDFPIVSSSRTLKLGASSDQYQAFSAHGIANSDTPIDFQGFPLKGVYITELAISLADGETFSVTLDLRVSAQVSVWIVVSADAQFSSSGINPVKRPPDRPAVCAGRRFYDGSNFGGNKLICGMHPTGCDSAGEEDKCPDWEAGAKYKRDLEITRDPPNPSRYTYSACDCASCQNGTGECERTPLSRPNWSLLGVSFSGNGSSLSDLVRERVQATQEQMRLGRNIGRGASFDFRESPDRYRPIAGGLTTQHATMGAIEIEIDPIGISRTIEMLRAHELSGHLYRFKIVLPSSQGVQECFVSGMSGENRIVLSSPIREAVPVESSWTLLQQEEVTSRDRALEQARSLVRSEFPEFTGRRSTCGCLLCEQARANAEPVAQPNYRRDYRMGGFPIYGFSPAYQEYPRPRVQTRLPRFTVQATNTAQPVRATQARLRSALQDLSRIERKLKDEQR